MTYLSLCASDSCVESLLSLYYRGLSDAPSLSLSTYTIRFLTGENHPCNALSRALGSLMRTRKVTQGNSKGTWFSKDLSTQDSGESSGVKVEV